MYLVYSSTRKTVRPGDEVPVPVGGVAGLTVVEVKKPNSKKPQGEVSLKGSAGLKATAKPQDIGAEWVA